jgi:hypothetical protein
LADTNGEKFPWLNDSSESLLLEDGAIIDNSVNKSINNDACKPSNEKDQDQIHNETNPSNNKIHVFNELIQNLVPLSKDTGAKCTSQQSPKEFLNKCKYLFLIFGSNRSTLCKSLLVSFVDFWKQFHSKHKFQVAYMSLEKKIDKSYLDLIDADWLMVDAEKKKLKVKLLVLFIF